MKPTTTYKKHSQFGPPGPESLHLRMFPVKGPRPRGRESVHRVDTALLGKSKQDFGARAILRGFGPFLRMLLGCPDRDPHRRLASTPKSYPSPRASATANRREVPQVLIAEQIRQVPEPEAGTCQDRAPPKTTETGPNKGSRGHNRTFLYGIPCPS